MANDNATELAAIETELAKRAELEEIEAELARRKETEASPEQKAIMGDEPIPTTGAMVLQSLLEAGEQIANAPVIKQGLAVLDRAGSTLETAVKQSPIIPLSGMLGPDFGMPTIGELSTGVPSEESPSVLNTLIKGEKSPSAQQGLMDAVEQIIPNTRFTAINFLRNAIPSAIGWVLDNPLDALLTAQGVKSVKAARAGGGVPTVDALAAKTGQKAVKTGKTIAKQSKQVAKNVKDVTRIDKLKHNARVQLKEITDDFAGFTKERANVAVKEAKRVRNALRGGKGKPSARAKANKVYGKTLNEIIDNADQPINAGQFDDFLTGIQRSVKRMKLPDNAAKNELLNKIAKYKLRFKKAMKLDKKTGKMVVDKAKMDKLRAKELDVQRDVINFQKDLENAVGSFQKVHGSDRVSGKVLSEFNARLGKFYQDRGIGALNELNAEYANVMTKLDDAEAVFKPFGKERAGIKSGKQFIEKFGKPSKTGAGVADDIDRELARFLEKGDDVFTKGLGDFTSNVEEMGNRLRILGEYSPKTMSSTGEILASKVQIMTDELNKLRKMVGTERVINNSKEFANAMNRIETLENNRKLIIGAAFLGGLGKWIKALVPGL